MPGKHMLHCPRFTIHVPNGKGTLDPRQLEEAEEFLRLEDFIYVEGAMTEDAGCQDAEQVLDGLLQYCKETIHTEDPQYHARQDSKG